MNLKHIPITLGTAAVLASANLTHAATAGKPSFTAQGILRSCLDPGFAPMEFYAHPGDAQPVGVDVDLTRALADVWGVKMQLMPVEFTGMLSALQAKRCDAVISGVLLKPERAEVLSAIPYLSTYVAVIARADNNLKVSGDLDLAGLTIATESGTAYAGLLEAANKRIVAAGRKPMLIQTYPKDSDAFQQLLVGRAAGVATQDVGLAHYNDQGAGKFKILLRFPVPDRFAIYVRKSPEDQAAITAAIARLRADGTLRKIVERWKLPLTALDTPSP